MARHRHHPHSNSRAKNLETPKVSASDSIAMWNKTLSNQDSFGTKIGFYLRYAFDVSAQDSSKKFVSSKDKELARDFLVGSFLNFEKDILKYRPDLSPEVISKLPSIYSRLAILPQESARVYLNENIQPAMPEMNGLQLQDVLAAYSDIAIYPGDDWMLEWQAAMNGKWNENNPKDKKSVFARGFMTLQRLAILDFIRGEASDSPAQKMATGMLNSVNRMPERFIEHDLGDNKPDGGFTLDRQLHSAALWFQERNGQKYDFLTSYKVESETHLSSGQELQLSGILKRAFIKVAGDIIIPGIDHNIDISAVFNDVGIGIELDGIYHLLEDRENNAVVYDGSTRFQTWLIDHLMPLDDLSILRVPAVFMNKQYQPPVWKSVLAEVARKDRGVYILHDYNDIRHASSPDAWILSFY